MQDFIPITIWISQNLNMVDFLSPPRVVFQFESVLLNYSCEDLEYLETLAHHQLLRQQTLLLSLLEVNCESPTGSTKNLYPQCVARTYNGQQCTRRVRTPFSDLCGNHLNGLPFGKFNETLEASNSGLTVGKKNRGRKPKKGHEISIAEVDLDLYIRTRPIYIRNKEYLLDEQGVIFTADSANNIVGFMQADGNYDWLGEANI